MTTGIEEIRNIPDIITFFGLGIQTSTAPITDGIANHNYLVETSQGEYVVKFLVSQTVENLENDISIQKQLKQAGIVSPQYLRSKDRRYIFASNNVNVVVSEKIDGVIPRKVHTKLAYDFGQKLATFHKFVVSLPHPNPKGLANPEVSGIKSPIFAQSLPQGMIHGDFHLGNVLVDPFDQDKIVAVLDFEEAGENIFIVDVAITVMAVCSSTNENAVESHLVQSTIKGYESVRKLSTNERTSFVDAIRYSAETWIKWFRENNHEKYAEKYRKRLNNFMQLPETLLPS